MIDKPCKYSRALIISAEKNIAVSFGNLTALRKYENNSPPHTYSSNI